MAVIFWWKKKKKISNLFFFLVVFLNILRTDCKLGTYKENGSSKLVTEEWIRENNKIIKIQPGEACRYNWLSACVQSTPSKLRDSRRPDPPGTDTISVVAMHVTIIYSDPLMRLGFWNIVLIHSFALGQHRHVYVERLGINDSNRSGIVERFLVCPL